MSEGKKENTRGEILLCPPMVVEWKVQDFFSFPKELNYYFRSPDFFYLDGTWYLECCPNGQRSTKSGWIDLYLNNKYSVSEHTISFQLGIRRQSGIECISKTHTADFEKGSSGWGDVNLIERASLLKHKRFVAPEDEITIFCRIRDRPTKDVASQTGASGVSTGTSEKDFNILENEVEDEEASHIPAGIVKLAQSLKDAFLSGAYHDTVIKVTDEEFHVHKFILVVRSPVFASMFMNDTIELSTGVITIDDCDPNAFKEFLSYLYSGKLENVCSETVVDLYFIADKYTVEELKAECLKFMINNISVDSFCGFILLAVGHGEKSLIKSATDYFIKNVKSIIVTDKWQCFCKEHPVESNELFIKAIMHLVPD